MVYTEELRDMEARMSATHGLTEDQRELVRQLNAANATIKVEPVILLFAAMIVDHTCVIRIVHG